MSEELENMLWLEAEMMTATEAKRLRKAVTELLIEIEKEKETA